MKLFGRSKKPAPSGGGGGGSGNSTQGALQALDNQEKLLKKRIEYLEMQNKELAREAVELNRAGKKQRALACLKRKKMREKQIDNNDNMLQNIITQRTALENAAFNAEHVTAQKQAIIGLRQATKEVTSEKIDELNDEMQELMDGVNEVQDALAHQLDAGVDLDDDELERELEELEQNELDEKMTGEVEFEAPSLEFPAAPAAKPTLAQAEEPAAAAGMSEQQRKEMEELAELEAWAG